MTIYIAQIIEYRLIPKGEAAAVGEAEDAGNGSGGVGRAAAGGRSSAAAAAVPAPPLFQHALEQAPPPLPPSPLPHREAGGASSVSVGVDGLGSTGLVVGPPSRDADGASEDAHANLIFRNVSILYSVGRA
jgi:hypothetical protein